MQARIAIIGLEYELAQVIRKSHFGPFIYHGLVPKFWVDKGRLFLERSKGVGMLPVDKVIFHGI